MTVCFEFYKNSSEFVILSKCEESISSLKTKQRHGRCWILHNGTDVPVQDDASGEKHE